MRQVICWFVYIENWFVYIGKNPRFTAFLDSNLHTRSAIVTENELGLGNVTVAYLCQMIFAAIL